MLLIWRRWRGWRRGRPFWGGLFTVVAGVEIGVLPLAPMKVMLHQGTAGVPTVVLAVIMVVLGLSGWFTPQHRGLAGIITVILATAALVLSNLGGFMIGTLLGVFGGALMFAWRPLPLEPSAEAGTEPEGGTGDADATAGPLPAAAFHSEAPVAVASRKAATAETSATAQTTETATTTGAADDSGARDTPGSAASGSASGSTSGGPSGEQAGSPTRHRSKFESADSSLAAAFGVDDDPFPQPRSDATRRKSQD
ncbi:DUF6114 domain-containing protein [Streptomyces marispadix]|uniref:DUF6114 domain-containing protein n=1 Tax=Streptomyces marispadix TaxID=2922868 RepID=A0ABS9SVQ7_9ACTN|nr:DUF6114 domain-containing protein [Streptomyces marispadix]MCH6160349.1 DUF6114 domain-containing protein [Streptomyces marispadix]